VDGEPFRLGRGPARCRCAGQARVRPLAHGAPAPAAAAGERRARGPGARCSVLRRGGARRHALALLLTAVTRDRRGAGGGRRARQVHRVRALAGLLPSVTRCWTAGSAATRRPRTPAARTAAPGRRAARRAGPGCRAAGGGPRGPADRSLDLERALSEGVRPTSQAVGRPRTGRAVRGRGQPAARSPGRPAAGRRRDGRAHVERDGVSLSHAASFLLVGTMNPEEGELARSCSIGRGDVEVAAARDVDSGRGGTAADCAFEADPPGSPPAGGPPRTKLAGDRGRPERLGTVRLPDAELAGIAALCAAFEVDGMRADLSSPVPPWRTGVAGRRPVAEEDVGGARLALPHRRRRDPFDERAWTTRRWTTPSTWPPSRPARRPPANPPARGDIRRTSRPRVRRRHRRTDRRAPGRRGRRAATADQSSRPGGTPATGDATAAVTAQPAPRRPPPSRSVPGCSPMPGVGEGAPGGALRVAPTRAGWCAPRRTTRPGRDLHLPARCWPPRRTSAPGVAPGRGCCCAGAT